MQIKLKLYASFSEYLPKGATGNVATVDVAEDASPDSVLQAWNLPMAEVHLVLVNGVFIPAGQRGRPLQPGDELAVWPAVAGG
ncbi:MAG: MoaD/ThiS family protein [Gammaproteobacteria bacterium]|nr:MoaD/ThiS family protein [Gammaproteobacteria bacterium]